MEKIDRGKREAGLSVLSLFGLVGVEKKGERDCSVVQHAPNKKEKNWGRWGSCKPWTLR